MEVPSPHEVRLALLDTNRVFQCLGDDQRSEHRSLGLCQTQISKNPPHSHSKNTGDVLKCNFTAKERKKH